MMKSKGQNVRIGGGFARIGSKSYAIDKINCVDVRQRRPNGIGPVVAFSAATVFCIMGGKQLAPLGLVFAVMAVVFFVRSKTVEYLLYLTTSSRDVAALKSRDFKFVNELREEIESAMVAKT